MPADQDSKPMWISPDSVSDRYVFPEISVLDNTGYNTDITPKSTRALSGNHDLSSSLSSSTNILQGCQHIGEVVSALLIRMCMVHN